MGLASPPHDPDGPECWIHAWQEQRVADDAALLLSTHLSHAMTAGGRSPVAIAIA